jgi:hypothetical protein
MRQVFTALLLHLFISLTGFCQTTRQMVVCDSYTRDGISFAAVLFYQDSILNGGVYTDATGRVLLTVPALTDQLVITCMGYNSKNILISEFLTDTIRLDPVSILIPEIAVHPLKKKNSIMELGYIKDSSTRAYGDYKNNELAVFVGNTTNREMLITELLYKIRQETKQRTIFRVHLYSAGTDRKTPGKELITSNSVFYVDGNHNSHAVAFDVTALKIVMPLEGIFIGLEWIGFADNNDERTSNSKYRFVGVILTHWQKEQLSLRKNLFKNGQWEELKIGFENGNMVQNFAFGVKVETL